MSGQASGWPIVSQNSARLLTSFFGVCGWGRILVPINFRLARAEVEYIIEHSGASVLLSIPSSKTAGRHRGPAPVRAGRCSDEPCSCSPTGGPRATSRRPAGAADENATATINYTSGTTARPKGVQLTHRNCWINASLFGWHMQVSDRTCTCTPSPCSTPTGGACRGPPPAMGCPQVALRKVDGAEILRRVERHGVTLLCAAPAVVNAVLDAAARVGWAPSPGRAGPGIVVAGAPPPSRTIERVQSELGWEFNQIYGLTETSPLLTVNRHRSEWDGHDAGRAGPQTDAGRGAGRRDRRCGWTSTARCSSGATR